eukprot:1156723-Pelagomonas_calceolata.AAC.7
MVMSKHTTKSESAEAATSLDLQAPSPLTCQSWPAPARPASQGCVCKVPTRRQSLDLAARAHAAGTSMRQTHGSDSTD